MLADTTRSNLAFPKADSRASALGLKVTKKDASASLSTNYFVNRRYDFMRAR